MIFFGSFGFRDVKGLNLNPKINKNSEEESKKQDSLDFLFQETPKDTFHKSTKRLNDFDSNILNQNMVQFLPSDSLRIELKLDNAEKTLNDVKQEIRVIDLLDLDREGIKLSQLEEKKQKINIEIQDYRSQYRELGILYAVTDFFADGYNKAKNSVDKFKVAFTGNSAVIKIQNLVPSLRKKNELKNTLEKFCTVQTSLSNMLSKSVNPFGEDQVRIDEFVSLMTKANKLDVQISRQSAILNKPKLPIKVYIADRYDKVKSYFKNLFQKKVAEPLKENPLAILLNKINNFFKPE